MVSMRVTVQTAQSRVFAVVVGLAALFAGSRAHAGPVEQMVEVASPPGKSDSMLVRYINGGGGLFLSTDMGKTWSLQCNSAFLAAGGRVQGPIAMLGDKTMLMLSSSGVFHADANGCGFTAEAPDITKNVVDFAPHPTDPMKVFAAVSNTAGMSGLIQRSADGQWTDFGVKDALSPISLRVVMREAGMRVYEVAVKATMMSTTDGGTSLPEYVMRVSDDEAKTWQEYPLPAEGNGRPRLRGVDPTNPERVLVVIDRSSATDTLLLSKDGGKTTAKYMELEEFGGLTFAPDGRVWIGDLGLTSGTPMTRGLYAAANLDAMPARLPMAMYPVQCLGWAPDTNTLYACQRFWFGNVNLTTGEFSTMLRFTTAPQFVSCPGEDPAMSCKAQLCLDYCGPAHFAAAPLCSAYNEPSCGKPVADMEAEDSDPPTSAAGSSGAGTAGTAAASGGGAGTAAGAGATSGGAAAAGTAGSGGAPANAGTTAPPAKSSSGCSCTVPSGSDPSEQLPWFAWGVLAAVGVWRRSRR
jgi:MYXO-CTERM domain-containing protein